MGLDSLLEALFIRVLEPSHFGTLGGILGTSQEVTAVYELRGPESYVRAKVVDSGGAVAWVQPVFVEGR